MKVINKSEFMAKGYLKSMLVKVNFDDLKLKEQINFLNSVVERCEADKRVLRHTITKAKKLLKELEEEKY